MQQSTQNEADSDILLKQHTRLLTPLQYEKLRAAMISKEDKDTIEQLSVIGTPEAKKKIYKIQRYQIVCDMLLHTGLRAVEAMSLERSWYRPSRRCIEVPKGACKKIKCLFTERTVMLSLAGCDAVEKYLDYLDMGFHMMKRVTMRDTLRRYATTAGIGTDGITTKMFRKTIVSWLVACFPEKSNYIIVSMGHHQDVLVKHYLGIAFTREEMTIARTRYLEGWGVLV